MLKSLLLRTETSTRHAKCTNAHPVSLSRWLGSSTLFTIINFFYFIYICFRGNSFHETF